MIRTKNFIDSIIEPCKIAATERIATFITPESGNAVPGGQFLFTLPSSECVDMTEAYCACNINMNTTDAEVPCIYLLDLTAAAAGSYRFEYMGKSSPILAYNATATQIQAALNSCPTIGGFGYTVAVTGTFPSYTITVSGFDGRTYGIFGDYDNLVFTVMTPLTSLTGSLLSFNQAGVYAYPRMDFNNPIISNISIQVGNNNPVNITDYAILANLIELCGPIETRLGDFYNNGLLVDGYHNATSYRIKISLDSIDLLKQIFPMEQLRQNIIIKFTIAQIANCLQVLSAGATLSITNMELHYHRLTLAAEEKTKIINKINGDGYIIPFQNFSITPQNISSTATTATLQFNPNVSNLLAVFSVMVPQTYAGTTTNPQKTSVFLRNQLGQLWFNIGSQQYPNPAIESVAPGEHDLIGLTSELERALSILAHVDPMEFDRQLYYNYAGGTYGYDPDNKVYIISTDELRRPSFVAGIGCVDLPRDHSGKLCKYNAIMGQNTLGSSNVSLNLRGLSLGQDCNVYIISLHQDFLKFKAGQVVWIQ